MLRYEEATAKVFRIYGNIEDYVVLALTSSYLEERFILNLHGQG
jgi:hypothetical protein